jgi:uncharacterized coiled-coil protein SlyX
MRIESIGEPLAYRAKVIDSLREILSEEDQSLAQQRADVELHYHKKFVENQIP